MSDPTRKIQSKPIQVNAIVAHNKREEALHKGVLAARYRKQIKKEEQRLEEELEKTLTERTAIEVADEFVQAIGAGTSTDGLTTTEIKRAQNIKNIQQQKQLEFASTVRFFAPEAIKLLFEFYCDNDELNDLDGEIEKIANAEVGEFGILNDIFDKHPNLSSAQQYLILLKVHQKLKGDGKNNKQLPAAKTQFVNQLVLNMRQFELQNSAELFASFDILDAQNQQHVETKLSADAVAGLAAIRAGRLSIPNFDAAAIKKLFEVLHLANETLTSTQKTNTEEVEGFEDFFPRFLQITASTLSHYVDSPEDLAQLANTLNISRQLSLLRSLYEAHRDLFATFQETAKP